MEMGITGWILRTFQRPLVRAEVEVRIVLKRQADEVADRVLGELRELLGGHLGMREGADSDGADREDATHDTVAHD